MESASYRTASKDQEQASGKGVDKMGRLILWIA